jgi:hypothetical protein
MKNDTHTPFVTLRYLRFFSSRLRFPLLSCSNGVGENDA